MNEQARPTDETAAPTLSQALHVIAEKFEDALRTDRASRVEPFLTLAEGAGEPHVHRDGLLRRLLPIEMRHRRKQGEALDLEEYLYRFPSDRETIRAVFHDLDQAQIATQAAMLGDTDTQPDSRVQGYDVAPGTRLRRFAILKVLGQGAFGTVCLARDEELDRLVAIKLPRSDRFTSTEAMTSFVTEAQTVAQLRHPGIVTIHDIGHRDDGTPFVVMEYIRGMNLTDRIRLGDLSHVESARLMSRIAEAVGHAHKLGFVHRDLKPGNVLLDEEGNPHVADFGLAVHETEQRRRKGELAGTYPYMSPEQIRGDVHFIDGRSDIWSLGVMLYQMLTGRLPFGGDNVEQLSDEILHRDPRPPRQINEAIPPELETIISKCCAKEAKDRYSTATDLARDLNRVVSRFQRTAAGSDDREETAGQKREVRIGFNIGRFSLKLSVAIVSLVLIVCVVMIPQYGWRLASTLGEGMPGNSEPAMRLDAAPPDNAPSDAMTTSPQESFPLPEPSPASAPEPDPSFTAGRPKQSSTAEDYVYACTVSDEQTGSPISDVAVTWELQRGGPLEAGQPRSLWQERFVSDSAGRFAARVPKTLVDQAGKWVWLEVHHPRYLPMKGIGSPLRLPDDPEREPDHRHLKLEPGVAVTGNVVLPDGKPAQHIPLMFARNREGFGDSNGGYVNGYWTSTDEQGRYRFFTKNTWPQRIHWFPEAYEANSKALTEDFGEQEVIRLKPGLALAGKVIDHHDAPLQGIVVRAQTGTRVPIMYATSNAEGLFRFTPLPPGKYALKPVRNYVDNRTGESLAAELPVPIVAIDYQLSAATASDSPLAVIQASELIRIPVQVVDGQGAPLSGYRLSIGDLGDYINAVLAKEVKESPGLYEFQFPKNQWIRDLRVRHPWSEVAFYQANTDVAPVAARAIVLGKAEEDCETIHVVIRKSATLNIRVRTEDGKEPTEKFSLGAYYSTDTKSRLAAAEKANRDFRADFIAPGLVHTQPSDQPWNPSIQQIAPGEPLELKIHSDAYRADPVTVTLEEGEVRSVELILVPKHSEDGDRE